MIKSLAKIKSSFFYNIKIILYDFFYSIYFYSFKVHKNNDLIKYNKIILTWAFKNNFAYDGSINDKYLNINSKKTKNILWVVVYAEKKLPKKIDNNIVIFQTISSKKINFFNTLKIFNFLIINIKYLLLDVKYFLFKISNYNNFSNCFLNNFKNYVNKDLKELLILYEGQPFQNNLINYIKKKKLNITTSGHVHSPPLALPTNFVHKFNSPDKIFLNGTDQVHCFNKILGWKKNKIKLIPSSRFLKNSVKMNSKIYLPFNIKYEKIVLSSLRYLINEYKIDIKNFHIKAHPITKSSKEIKKIVRKIKLIMKESKLLEIKKKKHNISIFIGTSGAIIEALERGTKVIHITEDPVLDLYSDMIWRSIKTKNINKNIFLYSLKKKEIL